MNEKRVLLVGACGGNGSVVPQIFVTHHNAEVWNIPQELVNVLKEGPENLAYWVKWAEALEIAHRVDDNGDVWELEQVGDLWAVCREVRV